MKIITIDSLQFDEFAKTHKYRNYYQTSNYGNIMSKFNYEVMYIGIEDDDQTLIGASLLLLQEGAMKTKIGYTPRGPLFDFTDSKKVEELIASLKNDLGKQGIVTLKIDPAIPLTIRDGKGNIININNEANIVRENLKNTGFNYKGENLYFETEKPRWEALTVLEGDLREIYQKFEKKTRNKINKAIKCGIEIIRSEDQNVTTLYDLVKKNGYPIGFYKELCKNFEKVDIFYAKLNTEKFVINSKQNYENELAKNEKIAAQFQNLAQQNEDRRDIFNKKILSDNLVNIYKSNLIFATKMLKEYPEGIIVAGALSLVYDKAAYLIVEGSMEKFRSTNANYLVKWRMINDYNNEKLKYLNLNAVTGDFDKASKYAGLNEIKASYNSVFTEYIGEYEIILNHFKYNLYKNFTKEN